MSNEYVVLLLCSFDFDEVSHNVLYIRTHLQTSEIARKLYQWRWISSKHLGGMMAKTNLGPFLYSFSVGSRRKIFPD